MAFLFPKCLLGTDRLVDLSGITWMIMMMKREKRKEERKRHTKASLCLML